jgi:hypothetical protein
MGGSGAKVGHGAYSSSDIFALFDFLSFSVISYDIISFITFSAKVPNLTIMSMFLQKDRLSLVPNVELISLTKTVPCGI